MARAVFMGSDRFSVPILEMLLTRGSELTVPVQVVGVVTQPDRPAGRGRTLLANPVKALAERYEVPILQPERVRGQETQKAILAFAPDVIVVASYGQILPERLVSAPPRQAVNLHPSLLPRWRGPSPISTAILQGDKETGTTLMLMTARMDAGPVLAQERTPIGTRESAGELEARLAALSADVLARNLPAWLEGMIESCPQNDELATYTTRVTKDDGRIDWTLPADYLARMVRAFNPWPSAYTFWQQRQLRLLRATVEAGEAAPGQVVGLRDGALVCGTGEGILLVEQLQLAGGKALDAPALVRGHPDLLDAQFS